MNILLAADGSRFTEHVLAYIAQHDLWLGAAHHYTVLHCVPAVPNRAAAALGKEVVEDHYREEAEKVFEPLRGFFSQRGIAATFVPKVGHVAEQIAAVADAGKFDLLVMGSHGHGMLGKLVMGSVATSVMAHCHTPVLLVR
jgi:nucleotide-binding universal stress UspA family protein